MAGIIGAVLAEQLEPLPNQYLSPHLGNLQLYPSIGTLSNSEVLPPNKIGSVGYPVRMRRGVSLVGVKNSGYLEDFYFQTHLIPSVLTLGNLLSSQVREVVVWNANFEDAAIANVTSQNAEGITYTIENTPLKPLEYGVYTINISTNGPPIISASITFDSDGHSYAVAITGRRVVMWPFIPQRTHKEGLEWKTDIISTFTKEQRISLRDAPRQTLAYDFVLDNREFSFSKLLSQNWMQRVYGVPIWKTNRYIGEIPAGTSSIVITNIEHMDIRVGGVLILWESPYLNEALEIATIEGNVVIFNLPSTLSYTAAYAAPVVFGRSLGGITYNRTASDYITANVEFLSLENVNLGKAPSTMYLDKPVVTQETILTTGSAQNNITRRVDVFDNGSSITEIEVKNDWATFGDVITFDTLTEEAHFETLTFLHYVKGKQKSFWLPSWGKDVVPTVDTNAGSTTLTCLYIGYALYGTTSHLMIKTYQGDMYYCAVESGVDNRDGTETLSIPLGLPVTIDANIESVSFMKLVRLNSDNVEINHGNAKHASTSVSVIEVPDNV